MKRTRIERVEPGLARDRLFVFSSFRTSRRGSILILSLWALAFLAALAIAVGSHVSTILDTARLQRDWVRARVAASSGAQYGAAMLAWRCEPNNIRSITNSLNQDVFTWVSTNQSGDPWYEAVTMEAPPSVNSGSGDSPVSFRVRFRIREAGVNLAQANQASLAGLVSNDLLGAAIRDWRTNRVAGLTGQQRADYDARVRALGTWGTIQELRLVPGMTEAIFTEIADRVTVFDPASYVEGESTGWALRGDGLTTAASVRVSFVARFDGRIVYWQED